MAKVQLGTHTDVQVIADNGHQATTESCLCISITDSRTKRLYVSRTTNQYQIDHHIFILWFVAEKYIVFVKRQISSVALGLAVSPTCTIVCSH